MANPPSPKQENNNKEMMKNSRKSIIKLNIGFGGMGIGGIVLLGGGLVAATLVSTLAIKRRRSSSKNSVNEPNQLELTMKSDDEPNQDFGLQNSSDEAATGMKLEEMQPKPNRILTPDENQNSGEKVDSGDDGIVVGEDQESSLIYIDSVSEVEKGHEKIIMLDREQQLETESGFPSITASRDGGGGGENDSEKSLDDSIEAMEEYEAVEVEEIPNVVVEDQETVLFMNEEAASLEKKEKDEMIAENCEGDLIDETGYPDSVVNELEMIEEAKIEVEDNLLEEEKEIDGHDEIMMDDCEGNSKQQTENNSEQVKGEEEAIKAACIETVNMEEMQLNKVREISSNGEHPSLAVDGTTVTEGKEEKGKETAQEVEHLTAKDESVNEQEKSEKGEMPQVQLIEVEDEFVNGQEKDKEGEMPPRAQLIEVDDQPVVREDNPPRQLMTTEDELVEKVRISNEDERSIEEAKNGEEDASEVIPEAKIGNHNTEENTTIVAKDQNDSDQSMIMKEDNSALKNYIEMFGKQASIMNQPWNLKLWTWSLLASIWCICHCYSKLPFPELSFVGSLLFVLILLGYRKRTKYLVKYE